MRTQRGFTLLEMLIVVALIMIMTAILLGRTGAMQREAQLQIATTDIVALIREARQDSVAIQGINDGTGTQFPSYGVHFDLGTPNQVISFIDCVADDSATYAPTTPPIVDENDQFYFDQANCGILSTLREAYSLPTNVQIDRIEATYPSIAGVGMTTTNYEEASILYLRPEPLVWITVRTSAGVRSVLSSGYVDVVLTEAGGGERAVRFSAHGLITTE